MLRPRPPPVISVLLPARDAATTVGAALRSVLAQSFDDFEVLAIDDGSRDDTRAVLQSSGDERVRVLDGGGRGLVSALMLGLGEARGELVARMDADDESLPQRFARSVEALRLEPTLAGVGTGVEIFRRDRPVAPNLQRYGEWLSSLTSCERLFRERYIESPLCHPSVMLRRSVLLEVGGWRDGPFPEDYELWLRLLESGAQLRCLDAVLYRWADHEQRLTRVDERYELRRHLELKARYLSARFKGAAALTVWGAGPTGLRLARLLRESGVAVERFIDVHPRKVGQRVHGLQVDPPEAVGAPGAGHLLSAVGSKGAREEIREVLHTHGWSEGVHFTCVA